MQSLFLDPAKKGNLAQTAICYTIAMFVFILLAFCCVGGIALVVRPNNMATACIALLPIVYVLYWAVAGAVRTVRVLSASPSVNPSSREFGAIQTMSVIMFGVCCFTHGAEFMTAFTSWTLCIQIFLTMFYVVFFVFGVLSKTPIAKSSWFGFFFTVSGLILSAERMSD